MTRSSISRSVSWSAQVEVFVIPARERLQDDRDSCIKSNAREHTPNAYDRQPSRSVSWSAHVEVLIIPARKRAPDDCACDVTSFSFEDDTLTPCALFSDDPTAVKTLATKRDTFG